MIVWLPVHVVLWIVEALVGAALWIVGWPVTVTLALRSAWQLQPSRFFTDPYGKPRLLFQWEPRWAWLIYGNEEDGIDGSPAFIVAHRNLPHWLRAVLWSAWRNPVNNLRFVWPFGISIDPARVRFVSNCSNSPQDDWTGERVLWAYAWQGAFAGFWIRWPARGGYGQFRIGWKLLPKDARGVPPTDYRSKGCGTGLQLQFRGGPR